MNHQTIESLKDLSGKQISRYRIKNLKVTEKTLVKYGFIKKVDRGIFLVAIPKDFDTQAFFDKLQSEASERVKSSYWKHRSIVSWQRRQQKATKEKVV